MPFEHSWKWLAPRLVKGTGAKALRSRPALAMVEQLDDRLLLAATPGGTDPSIIAVLIGLLRNDVAVRSGEISALATGGVKLDPNDPTGKHADETAFLKIEQDFQTLDSLLYSLNLDAFNGRFNQDKQDVAQKKIDNVFTDIMAQVPLIDPSGAGLLLPAVQKVRVLMDGSVKFASALTKMNDPKSNDLFSKVQNDLITIDADVFDASSDEMKYGADSDKTHAALQKIDSDFVSLEADVALLGDGSVAKVLGDDIAAVKITTDAMVMSLPSPTDTANIIAILIGLLKTNISLRSDELDALRLAEAKVNLFDNSSLEENGFFKLQMDFAKLDDIVHDANLDAINGRFNTNRQTDARKQVDNVSNDIMDAIIALNGGSSEGFGLLLPAVQKVSADALAALDAATHVGKYRLDPTLNDLFSKAEYELVKIDQDMEDYSEKEFKWGPAYKKSADVFARIGDDFVTLNADIAAMGDGSVFKAVMDDLTALQVKSFGLLLGLPNPLLKT